MSVSGWDTRSMASARQGDYHRYSLQSMPSHYRGDLPVQQQQPMHRASEVPPRHFSFAQPPPQHQRDHQRGQQIDVRQRRQSVSTAVLPSRAELIRQQQRQYATEQESYSRERRSMPQAPAFRQGQIHQRGYSGQYQEAPRHDEHQRQSEYMERRPHEFSRGGPQQHDHQFEQRHSVQGVYQHYAAPDRVQHDPRAQFQPEPHRNHPQFSQHAGFPTNAASDPEQYDPQAQYRPEPQRTHPQFSQQVGYPPNSALYREQHEPTPNGHHDNQYSTNPPVYMQPSQQQPPPPPAPSTSEEPQPNLDSSLLGKRWKVQIISYLYHFQRAELGEYANELVKFLRGHAIMTYEQEFGYSVTIRYNSDCVIFQIVEARDLHAEFLIEKMEQPQRPETMEVINPRELEERHRTGSLAIYFPRSAEHATADPVRRPTHRYSISHHNGSDHSQTSSAASHHQRREAKYAFLQRGNDELMVWVLSWVQRRFQCATDRYAVQVSDENLRRVARNWVIESLEKEQRVSKAIARNTERIRKASEAEEQLPTSMDTRAPVLLKYRTRRTTDVVKAFTATLPWAAIRRYYSKMDGGVSSALGSVPEVLERVESEYFGHVAKDLAAMELVGFQMEEVEVDTQGYVKFHKPTLVQSILQSYLDVLAVRQTPVPQAAEGETTF